MKESVLQLIKEAARTNKSKLDLARNQLTSLPPAITELKNLTELILSGNQLTSLPPAITELKNLTKLHLSDNQLTSLPSAIAELKNLTKLNLRGNQLTSLPSEITELKNLTELILAGNQLTSLPLEITELKNLTELGLSYNQLTSLPLEITELKNLTRLGLAGNQLTSLPLEITELKNLTRLGLSGNQLTSLPPEITELKNLTELILSGNQLTSLPPEITELKNLTELDLHRNQLTLLPPAITELKNLTELDLSGNQLTSLPLEITELKNLTELDLSGNQLTSLPPEITELKNLTRLGLSGNQLTSLPLEITELKNLTRLGLSGNQLTSLPPEITELNLEIKWKSDYSDGIYLENNPLETPPIDIVKKGKEAVKDYFRSLEGEKLALNEVKVLLVGDGGSGKTSLVKRLVGEKFDPHEPQTHGININRWEVKEGDKDIKVNFWDFGGQEIMHATHQFFLSKRSLYILVLDGRKEEKTEYWLKHAESFGGNSPVLVVLNKIDENPAFEVNRKFLQEKYPSIRGFCRLSCENREGIDDFKEHLIKELAKIKHLETVWPKSWFNIKTQLEGMSDNFISYDQYVEMCNNEKIEEASQDTLVDFLNDLGIILHFNDIELLDTHVLEPKWVTGAVYKIVTSEKLADKKGVLKLRLLTDVLKKEKETDYYYPRSTYRYIIDLMKKFELCYTIDNRTVLIPDLLDVQEPEFDFDDAKSLKFVIDYDFLPSSIMPRFIVRNNEDIKDRLQWRTGVVLEDTELHSTAVIKADEKDEKIYIYVNGEQKRHYFSTIRRSFREINGSFEKLDARELVPLPDNDEILIEYEELVGYELGGKDEYYSGKLRKSYSVRQLLNGIEKESERIMKYREMEREGKGSYIDSSIHITAEKVDIVDSQIVTGKNVQQTLSVTDKKELLDSLVAFQNEIAKLGIPEKELNTINSNIDAATEEAKKEKPDTSTIKTSVENALDTIGKVGDTIEKVSNWKWTKRIAKILKLGAVAAL